MWVHHGDLPKNGVDPVVNLLLLKISMVKHGQLLTCRRDQPNLHTIFMSFIKQESAQNETRTTTTQVILRTLAFGLGSGCGSVGHF